MPSGNIHRITLKDIAQACGLSVPTVSQILNNRETNFCSQAKRELVHATAQKLGYYPNMGYKLMHGMSTKTVAIIVSHSYMKDFDYIRQFLSLLIEELSNKGYAVYIEIMPSDWSKRNAVMLSLVQRGAEHFISIGKPCEWEELDRLEQQTGLTMITFGSDYRNTVNVNLEQGVAQLLECCLQRKCKKFRAVMSWIDDRCNALGKVLNLSKPEIMELLYPLPELMATSSETKFNEQRELGYRKTKEIFTVEPDTDAVLYLSDYFAIGGAEYVRSTGRVLGKDVHLLACNNTLAVQSYPFPISSISLNIEEVVRLISENFTNSHAGQFSVNPIPYFRE